MRNGLRPHALCTTAASWLAVRICAPDALHLVWDSGNTEIVFGVIFPLTYAIGQYFTRRERCADVLASMKAAAINLFLVHRDFDAAAVTSPDGARVGAPGVGGQSAQNVARILHDYLVNVRQYLALPATEPGGEDGLEGQVFYNRCLTDLSTISVLNERLAFRPNYANGAMGRVNEYLRVLMAGFDSLRVVHRYYGSPLRLTYFVAVMVHVAPVFLAPYFRHWCSEYNHNLGTSPRNVCIQAYLSSAVFSAVLSTLYAVAIELADPFKGIGPDDLHFTIDKEFEEATRSPVHEFNDAGEVVLLWEDDLPALPVAPPRPLPLRKLVTMVSRRFSTSEHASERETLTENGV